MHITWDNKIVVVLIIFVTSILIIWGLWKQHKKIREKESGQSVSILRFSSVFFLFTATFLYGLTKETAVERVFLISIGLSRAIFLAFILWDLWKFKGFTKVEWYVQAALLTVLVAMILAPERDGFLVFFQGVSLAGFIVQPYEIWWYEKSGAVEIKLLYINLLSSLFWCAYGFLFKDLPYMIMSPLFFIVIFVTIILWYKYRKPDTL